MAVSRKGRLRITSTDGTAVTTKVELEDGTALPVTSVDLSISKGDPWRAKVDVWLPSLDILTDAEMRMYSSEMTACLLLIEVMAKHLASLPQEARGERGDELLDVAQSMVNRHVKYMTEREETKYR